VRSRSGPRNEVTSVHRDQQTDLRRALDVLRSATDEEACGVLHRQGADARGLSVARATTRPGPPELAAFILAEVMLSAGGGVALAREDTSEST